MVYFILFFIYLIIFIFLHWQHGGDGCGGNEKLFMLNICNQSLSSLIKTFALCTFCISPHCYFLIIIDTLYKAEKNVVDEYTLLKIREILGYFIVSFDCLFCDMSEFLFCVVNNFGPQKQCEMN